jgi:hypothetical protein
MRKNDYRENLKKFINFLKENNCFVEFKHNFETDKTYKSEYSHPTSPTKYFKYEDINRYIINAFGWNPVRYWSELDNKWKKCVKS